MGTGLDAQVIVVGGGPVGSVLGMLLGRSGVRTLILEKALFPRDKPCGEGLMPGGVAVLDQLGIDLAREGFPPLAGIRYRTLDGMATFGAFRSGPGASEAGFGVRRLRFDALLAERAAATPNVELRTGCAVDASGAAMASGSKPPAVRWPRARSWVPTAFARLLGSSSAGRCRLLRRTAMRWLAI